MIIQQQRASRSKRTCERIIVQLEMNKLCRLIQQSTAAAEMMTKTATMVTTTKVKRLKNVTDWLVEFRFAFLELHFFSSTFLFQFHTCIALGCALQLVDLVTFSLLANVTTLRILSEIKKNKKIKPNEERIVTSQLVYLVYQSFFKSSEMTTTITNK